MTLRKISIDNIVKFIPQSKQTQSVAKGRDSKSNTGKKVSLPRKQNKNFSQNKKELIARVFGLLK